MIWLIVCGFGFLAASVFMKNLLIYIALCATWLGVIFYQDTVIPDYIRLAAVAIVFFGVISIMNLNKRGGAF
jgi:hypothetical protein